MFEIKDNIENTIIINKSSFITLLIRIDNVDEITRHINDIKEKFKDATHYCYAYIINGCIKSSDDGEPGGTAGIPILDVLQKNNLTNILCVVVRYFGGIKLGASGLVRAYSRSVRDALKLTTLLQIIPSKIYEITFSYSSVKYIDNILKNEVIINKDFNETITYKINIINDDILKKIDQNCINIKFICNSNITK